MRALDKASKDYYKRMGRWGMPGGVTVFIGLVIALTGFWIKIIVLANLGMILIGLGVLLITAGKLAHWHFRK